MNYEWQPTQQNDQLQKLHEILDLVWRISEETDYYCDHDISMGNKMLYVKVYGFDHYKDSYTIISWRKFWGQDFQGEPESLDQIIKELEEWL